MHRYGIHIHGLFTAQEHRVFGKAEQDLSGKDLLANSQVNLLVDSGIEGDRFCRHRPDYNGHVTFFSQEVWEELVKELNLPNTLGPELTRRNIIVSGVDLKSLYGVPFEINGVQFKGTIHCAPCPAMNRAIGAGATAVLRSRGGLRAQVKSNGRLRMGACDLKTSCDFDPKNAASQIPLPKLP